jgi:hypothetical protein
VLFIFSTMVFNNALAQIQIGADIDGEWTNDHAGVVSLSADGSRLAIGSAFNDDSGNDAGHVRVYLWSEGAWQQMGDDIDGEAAGDHAGEFLSLSADGSRLAIGAPLNDGNGENSGHVRVYQWSDTIWQQMGDDIDGEAAGDEAGSVSLSSDGVRLAIGAPLNDGSGEKSGHVRVYEWSGTAWLQVGLDIDGEAAGDEASAVSLSADGARLAIGAAFNSSGGIDSGHARVYQWSVDSWQQIGADIDGESSGNRAGVVSLSENGTRLAIGAPLNFNDNGEVSGHVRVYQLSGDVWQQIGADIDGEAAGDRSGQSVSLSADGNRLAIGARFNDGNGIDSGHGRVYHWSDEAWQQHGIDIDGEEAGDGAGLWLSLSADGRQVAVGAWNATGINGGNSGSVRVFKLPGPELNFKDGFETE